MGIALRLESMFQNSSSLLGFVIQHGLVTGAEVAPLRELFEGHASPEQIDAFLAERTQGWATWKTWFTRFERAEAAILADAKARQALETLAGAGAAGTRFCGR